LSLLREEAIWNPREISNTDPIYMCDVRCT
jgi:hypothetical protein